MAASAGLDEAISQIRARLALGRREGDGFSASPFGTAPATGFAPDAVSHSSLLATPASRHMGGRLTHQPSPSVLGAYERRLEADVGLRRPFPAAGSSRSTPRSTASACDRSPFPGAHQPASARQQPQHHSTLTGGSALASTQSVLGGGGSSSGAARGSAVGAGLGADLSSARKQGSSMLLERQGAPQLLTAKGASAADPLAAYRPLAAKAAAAADPLAAYRSPNSQTAAAAAAAIRTDALAAYRPASAVKASTAAAAPGSYATVQARLRHMQQDCQHTAERNSALAASAGPLGVAATKSQNSAQQGFPLPSLQLQQLLERQKRQQPDFLISAAFPGSSAGCAASPAAQAASPTAADACSSRPGSFGAPASQRAPAMGAAQGGDDADSPAAVSVRLGPVFDAVLVDGSSQHSQSAAAAAASQAMAGQPAGGGSGSRRPLGDQQTAQHAQPAASPALLVSRLNELDAQVGSDACKQLSACQLSGAARITSWHETDAAHLGHAVPAGPWALAPLRSMAGLASFMSSGMPSSAHACCSCEWSACAARMLPPAAQHCSTAVRSSGSGCSSRLRRQRLLSSVRVQQSSRHKRLLRRWGVLAIECV